ncbi:MAG: alpha/beta hydrolase [Pirellulaceae bacterium]
MTRKLQACLLTVLVFGIQVFLQEDTAQDSLTNEIDSRAKQIGDITIGQVFSHTSRNLGEEREFRVLLPADYEKSQSKHPVVYVLDGESCFLSAFGAVKTLAGVSSMPNAIVVAITNADRRSEMSPPSMEIRGVENSRGDEFLAYLADELVPFIDSQYRTLPLRILIGHSHGALFNLYALSERPDAFRWHLALDAPMHLDDFFLEKQTDQFLDEHPTHSGRLVVGWNRYGWTGDRWEKLLGAGERGFRVDQIDLPGETHSSMYHTGMYQGLKRLFFDYEYRHTEILTMEDIDKRYEAMNNEYGYEIRIPLWALRYGALEHLVAADAVRAKPFVDRLISEYNTEMLFDDNVKDWLNELETNPPTETRADYLGNDDPQSGEISDFIGTWTGGNGYTIEIVSVEETVKGSIRQRMPGGEVLSSEIKKFVLCDDGSLEVSQANGMPPLSGLIVFRLSPPADGSVSVEQRFMAYWPRMDSAKMIETFELTK